MPMTVQDKKGKSKIQKEDKTNKLRCRNGVNNVTNFATWAFGKLWVLRWAAAQNYCIVPASPSPPGPAAFLAAGENLPKMRTNVCKIFIALSLHIAD